MGLKVSDMNNIEKYDYFIFDLYGTLIDLRTDEWDIQTWKKWGAILDEKKIKHPVSYIFRYQFFKKDKLYRKRMLSLGEYTNPEIDVIDIYKELFQKYGNKGLPEELIYEVSYQFRVASREYIKLFPGVEEFLKKIRESGKHAYILSNAQASYTLPEIKMFGLDELTDDFIMSSDYKCMKPDVKFFDELIVRHNMDKSKTVMIGDSLSSDIEGAGRAGIDSIHLIDNNHPNIFYIENVKKI